MTTMRAKMIVSNVTGSTTSESLTLRAVCKSDAPYPATGLDENNTFACYTPSATLTMCVNNPALIGKIKEGDVFYVDFTPA